MRYTVSHLRSEIKLYHITTLYIVGLLGPVEIPLGLLTQLIRDGMSDSSAKDPHVTSPWLLEVPRNGVGILRPNPKGGRNRDGTRGGVRITGLPGRSSQPGMIGGRTRTRRMYQDCKPVSDAPLLERVQSVRSRLAAKRKKAA